MKKKKPYGGYLAIVSILLILTALCSIALAVLGHFNVHFTLGSLDILFSLEEWLGIFCVAVGGIALLIWVWFLCVVCGLRKRLAK